MSATLEVAFAGTLQYSTGYVVGRVVDGLMPAYQSKESDSRLLVTSLAQLFIGYGALSEIMRLMVSFNGELRSPIGDAVSTTAFFMAQPNLQARLGALAAIIENRLRLAAGLPAKLDKIKGGVSN
jgi:hypothetical protein